MLSCLTRTHRIGTRCESGERERAMPKACMLLVAAGLTGVVSAAAQADLVIGNLTDPFAGAGQFSSSISRAAVPFTLGAGFTPANLSAITLRVATPGAQAFNIGVSLHANAGGTPGALLADCGVGAVPVHVFGDVAFTPGASFALLPNTTYWVVMEHLAGPGESIWAITTSTTRDAGSNPAANFILPLVRANSIDSGQSYFLDTSFGTHMFSVSAIVPSPAGAALMWVGGLAAVRRRRA